MQLGTCGVFLRPSEDLESAMPLPDDGSGELRHELLRPIRASRPANRVRPSSEEERQGLGDDYHF